MSSALRASASTTIDRNFNIEKRSPRRPMRALPEKDRTRAVSLD